MDLIWAEYYSNPKNLETIASFCKYREVVIIKREPRDIVLRPLKVFKGEHLGYWIERLKLTEIKFDLYVSNASIRLPPLPYDLKELKNAREMINDLWKKWSEGKEPDFVTGFDIFADIDVDNAEQREKARNYALRLYDGLKEIGYNPQVWDTSNGFHVIVLGRFTPEYSVKTLKDICDVYKIPTSINGNSKPFVDLSVSGDIRRIRRCPYSLHSKTGKIMKRIG